MWLRSLLGELCRSSEKNYFWMVGVREESWCAKCLFRIVANLLFLWQVRRIQRRDFPSFIIWNYSCTAHSHCSKHLFYIFLFLIYQSFLCLKILLHEVRTNILIMKQSSDEKVFWHSSIFLLSRPWMSYMHLQRHRISTINNF